MSETVVKDRPEFDLGNILSLSLSLLFILSALDSPPEFATNSWPATDDLALFPFSLCCL